MAGFDNLKQLTLGLATGAVGVAIPTINMTLWGANLSLPGQVASAFAVLAGTVILVLLAFHVVKLCVPRERRLRWSEGKLGAFKCNLLGTYIEVYVRPEDSSLQRISAFRVSLNSKLELVVDGYSFAISEGADDAAIVTSAEGGWQLLVAAFDRGARRFSYVHKGTNHGEAGPAHEDAPGLTQKTFSDDTFTHGWGFFWDDAVRVDFDFCRFDFASWGALGEKRGLNATQVLSTLKAILDSNDRTQKTVRQRAALLLSLEQSRGGAGSPKVGWLVRLLEGLPQA